MNRLFVLIVVTSIAQLSCAQGEGTAQGVCALADTAEASADSGHFDGILCPSIHKIVATDPRLSYRSYWKSDAVVTCSTNDVKRMRDTLWLCLLDSTHSAYALPFKGRITSRFGYRRGRRHNGTDIDLETGDTVVSAFDGRVRYAKLHKGGFGKLVIVRHYNGLETYYAHCSKLLVAPNQEVKAGEPIALGGNTGRSTGSHLHFEVRFYDNPIDPEQLFDFSQGEVVNNLLVHAALFAPDYTRNAAKYSKFNIGGEDNTHTTEVHSVQRGETLYGIALRYGTTVYRLCRLNKIKATSILKIGKMLKIQP